MKTLLDILRLVREELISMDRDGVHGLCSIAFEVLMRGRDKDIQDVVRFKALLEASHPYKRKFFTHENRTSNDKDQFYWKMGEVEPRLKWLDGQIETLEMMYKNQDTDYMNSLKRGKY